MSTGLIDVHAHWFPEHLGRHGRGRLGLTIDAEDSGQIHLDGKPFRTVNRRLWDPARRATWVGEQNWGHQVIAPIPVAMEVAADEEDPAFAAAINDDIAAACAASGGVLLGMGCLPWHDPAASLIELRRFPALGLIGLEIGTRAGRFELNDPEVEAVLAEASRLGLAVLVHPIVGGAGVLRPDSASLNFGLGMLTDTAIAAAGLVLGGTIGRLPDLRIAFSHGCGSFAGAWPRLKLGVGIFDRIDTADLDAMVRRLWVDTLVFDPALLHLLVQRFGPERIVFGTDDPFFPTEPTDGIDRLHAAQHCGWLPYADPIAQLTRNARDYLALDIEGESHHGSDR